MMKALLILAAATLLLAACGRGPKGPPNQNAAAPETAATGAMASDAAATPLAEE